MASDLLTVIRYFISSEESRNGRKDYWNSVYLADKTPLNRACLEVSKVMFIITGLLMLMMVLSRL